MLYRFLFYCKNKILAAGCGHVFIWLLCSGVKLLLNWQRAYFRWDATTQPLKMLQVSISEHNFVVARGYIISKVTNSILVAKDNNISKYHQWLYVVRASEATTVFLAQEMLTYYVTIYTYHNRRPQKVIVTWKHNILKVKECISCRRMEYSLIYTEFICGWRLPKLIRNVGQSILKFKLLFTAGSHHSLFWLLNYGGLWQGKSIFAK